MVCLHIDINDHIITLNCPSWHYAMKLIERQNWKNFDSAWIFNSKGIMIAKFILGGDRVGIHFFE